MKISSQFPVVFRRNPKWEITFRSVLLFSHLVVMYYRGNVFVCSCCCVWYAFLICNFFPDTTYKLPLKLVYVFEHNMKLILMTIKDQKKLELNPEPSRNQTNHNKETKVPSTQNKRSIVRSITQPEIVIRSGSRTNGGPWEWPQPPN